MGYAFLKFSSLFKRLQKTEKCVKVGPAGEYGEEVLVSRPCNRVRETGEYRVVY